MLDLNVAGWFMVACLVVLWVAVLFSMSNMWWIPATLTGLFVLMMILE